MNDPAISERARALGAALAVWATRDDTKPQPEVRQAANTAMDAIDAMLADLYAVRQTLVTEMRASDDERAARVDAMLADQTWPGKNASLASEVFSRSDRYRLLAERSR
jgi:hypothetical protein